MGDNSQNVRPPRIDKFYLKKKKTELEQRMKALNHELSEFHKVFGRVKNFSNNDWRKLIGERKTLMSLRDLLTGSTKAYEKRMRTMERLLNRRRPVMPLREEVEEPVAGTAQDEVIPPEENVNPMDTDPLPSD